MGESFIHELRVRYGECDPQGIVFNANYLLYFDVAFTELWRDAVGPWQEMVERGYDAVVAHADVDFRAPARYDDVLALRAQVIRLGRTAITTEIDVMRERGAARRDAPAPRLRVHEDVGEDRPARLGSRRTEARRRRGRRADD